MVIFDGQMSAGDLELLSSLAETKKPDMAIEVGSWKGLSTSHLAKHCKALYCVDTWKAAPSTPAMEAEARSWDILQIFRHNMREMGVEGHVYPMVMPSEAAAGLIADNSLDFVFIDADHSYSSVLRDIRMWMPKVKAGGVLCGHDCDALWTDCPDELKRRIEFEKESDYLNGALDEGRGIHPGVTCAIRDIFQDKVSRTEKSSIWWVQL